MAFSGVHVVCGRVSISNGAALLGAQSWSQTMTAAGTTSLGAVSPQVSGGEAFIPSSLGFEVAATADAWVAWGAAPDASQTTGNDGAARILVRAGETRNVFCRQGDKLAWVAV